MKNIFVILIFTCWAFVGFSQNSYYLDGIGFNYSPKTKIFDATEAGVTYVVAGNVTITKSKIDRDKRISAEQIVKKTSDEIEETTTLPIIQRDDVINETIGIQSIETKSVTIIYKKKIFNRLYAFIQDDYLIQIVVTGVYGKVDKNTKMILDSFYFMPEN